MILLHQTLIETDSFKKNKNNNKIQYPVLPAGDYLLLQFLPCALLVHGFLIFEIVIPIDFVGTSISFIANFIDSLIKAFTLGFR